MNLDSKIFVAGHRGLVGSAFLRFLEKKGHRCLLTRSKLELDLSCRESVFDFFACNKPEYVILAAARVGGILDNDNHPVSFIRDNLSIQWNIIEACYKFKVKRLLFLGSSCIYPVDCERPIKETSFLSGRLEPTNQSYAVAKIAGIQHCWAYNRQFHTEYICAMPTNLYGPNDNYDINHSHVLAALIRKFHDAKTNGSNEVVLWGTGSPKREFLHVDDLISACYMLLSLQSATVDDLFRSNSHPPIINIGSGEENSIEQLSKIISKIIGFEGAVRWDRSRPDGVQSKVMDISLMKALGWEKTIPIEVGINDTYQVFLQNIRDKVSSSTSL